MLLEHTYEICLEAALRGRVLRVDRQVPVRVRYVDVDLDCGYRIDMMIERQVVVELKVVEKLAPVHVSQVLSYLRLAELHVGLVFNHPQSPQTLPTAPCHAVDVHTSAADHQTCPIAPWHPPAGRG